MELEKLELLAKALGVTVVDLLTDTEETSGVRKKQALWLAIRMLEEIADGM